MPTAMPRSGAIAADHSRHATTGVGRTSVPFLLVTANEIDQSRPLSAIPSVGARIAAFAAIILAGLTGAIIGGALVSVQCEGDCALPIGIGLLIGAVAAAVGMAVVAVLVLRAIGEWREYEDRAQAGHAPR
jgi:putative effector of murein hydrolase